MNAIGRILVLLTALIAGSSSALAADDQVIDLQVSMPSRGAYVALDVEVTRLGSRHTVRLRDDGGVPNDLPHDGIWNGRMTGDYSRTISVRMFGHRSGGTQDLLYSGIERTEDARHVLVGWRIMATGDGHTAVRTPLSYPGNVAEMFAALPLITGFGWGLFLLLYVGMLVRLSRKDQGEE